MSRTAIKLPEAAFKILQWNAPNGSYVLSGAKVATAVKQDSSTPGVEDDKPKRKRAIKRGKPNLADLLKERDAYASRKATPGTQNDAGDRRIYIKASADGIVRYDESSAAEDGLVCGWIESCNHPTIFGSMCALCGCEITPEMKQQMSKGGTENDDSMSRMTVAGLTVSISKEESQDLAKQEAARLHKQRRLSLVLDLDHTLVHATADRRASKIPGIRSLVLPVPTPVGVQYQVHYVKLRPNVVWFLKQAMENYEVGVYTAGTRDYAEQIVIVLAREIVGAKYDQIDLDNIRRDIEYTKFKLKEQQEESGKEADAAVTKAPVDEQTTDDEPPKKKRKRVTFEEPLPKHQTRPVTEEDLEQLQTEIAIAEQKEKEALDFRKTLFGTRIVSRTDVEDLGRDVKSLKRVFPCGGTMAAIVDDREDVWANADEIFSSRNGEPPDNLLLVRPYHWKPFQGFADVNNSSGHDLTEDFNENDDTEIDEQLLWTGDILRRLHARYYRSPGSLSVSNLLREMRKEVLMGCRLALSGLIPMANHNSRPNEPRHAVLRYVECLGGEVSQKVDRSTTHVIGARDGTDKVLSARKIKGCQILRISWLMECWWSITIRAIEDHHLLKHGSSRPDSKRVDLKSQTRPLEGSTKENTSSDSDSDADDNDDAFMDELADEMGLA